MFGFVFGFIVGADVRDLEGFVADDGIGFDVDVCVAESGGAGMGLLVGDDVGS